MKKALYFECAAGISGDMTVAALLDLGADEEMLRRVLSSVPVGGFQIEISHVKKAGVLCKDFHVILDEEHENHDHDMNYLHGNLSEEHHHDHHHEHHYHEHHHHHEHRGLAEIYDIIEKTEMSSDAKNLARHIFGVLAEAEAGAHGVKAEEVHFHEVGAVDSIVDIIAVAVCLCDLGFDEVFVPSVSEGKGTVRCQHGILPIPVPAVANIVAKHAIVVNQLEIQGEFVTPTGAAIVAAVRTDKKMPGTYRIEKIGMGAGKREYELASILRIYQISYEEEPEEEIYQLESNIDDSTGEALGYTMECLLNAGAKDVSYAPLYMKKNRPAYELHVLCEKEKITELENIIFQNTTTIGIRRYPVQRRVLSRRSDSLETPHGTAQVKICKVGEREVVYPEYESVVMCAKNAGCSYQEMYDRIRSEYQKK